MRTTHKLLAGACALLCSVGASAQSVTIGSTSVGVGATTASIPVTFTAGASVVSYQIDVNITRGGVSPIAPNGQVTRVNVDGTCSGNAISTATGLALRFTDIDLNNDPLVSGTTCNLTFPLDVGNLTVGDTITLTPNFTEFNDAGGAVMGTVTPGTISIAAGPAVGPTVTYTPAPNAAAGTVTFGAAGSIGGTTTSNVGVAGAGGQNSGTTTIDQCALATGTGVSFPGATNMVCTAGGSCTDGMDANLTATCTATNAAQTGTFTCRERRQNETAPGDGTIVETTQTWGFTCPAANVAPTITPAPAAGPVSTSVVGQGQTSSTTFSFTPSGGSGTGSASVNGCSIAAPFSLVPANPNLTFTGSGTMAQTFQVQCTAGAAAQGPQNLTCSVGGVNTVWAVTCPAGLPVAAPNMNATPAEDADDTVDATAEVTFAAPVGLAGNATSSIALAVTGGIDDGAGAAETVAISGCAISNNAAANITITTQPAGTAFGVGSNGATSIGLRCNGNAAATTAELRCNVTQSANGTPAVDARLWDIACPAAITAPEYNGSADTFTVQGQPGNLVVAQSTITNTGDAPLTVTGCTATTDAAGITFTAPNSPIAINGGTGTLSFSCTAPGLNQTITEVVTCDTNDADENPVTFTMNCTGANLLPIPAVGGLGKALMAALIIGLGLIGLGLRRQAV
ncbi:MAG: hypothetical protein IPK97_00360 [Ahniella sp.]|nr:hypothetical protein [Ahniella sp.]